MKPGKKDNNAAHKNRAKSHSDEKEVFAHSISFELTEMGYQLQRDKINASQLMTHQCFAISCEKVCVAQAFGIDRSIWFISKWVGYEIPHSLQ